MVVAALARGGGGANVMDDMTLRACAEIRAFADGISVRGTPHFRYIDFWNGFPEDEKSSLQTMFRVLFGGIGLQKPVAIWSVFAHHHPRPPDDETELRSDRYVHVAFSGEHHALDVAGYDLNLVMAPDNVESNVVAYLGFAAIAHEFGLWPLLAGHAPPRPDRKFCVAVVSNPEPGSARGSFLPRLHARRPIHSCGRWMNTTGFLAPRDVALFGDRYYPFLAEYKFMVCFENTRRAHYLTEKLAHAYAAGCVPVYWGAPEAPAWLNSNAFLSLEDESDDAVRALIDRMLALDADDDAYAAVFREPLLPGPVPEVMRLDAIRAKVESTLRRARPDAF
jgi:hypothetical protein